MSRKDSFVVVPAGTPHWFETGFPEFAGREGLDI
jgi:hypothetical protein